MSQRVALGKSCNIDAPQCARNFTDFHFSPRAAGTSSRVGRKQPSKLLASTHQSSTTSAICKPTSISGFSTNSGKDPGVRTPPSQTVRTMRTSIPIRFVPSTTKASTTTSRVATFAALRRRGLHSYSRLERAPLDRYLHPSTLKQSSSLRIVLRYYDQR
jgi:hypothetical protein